jgi:hypothetical protein
LSFEYSSAAKIHRHDKYFPLLVQSKYKPDGWLGMLLGTKLYIDFTKKIINRIIEN